MVEITYLEVSTQIYKAFPEAHTHDKMAAVTSDTSTLIADPQPDDKESKTAIVEPVPLTDDDIEKYRMRAKNVPAKVKDDVFRAIYKELILLLKMSSQHIAAQANVNVKAKSDIEQISRLLKIVPNDEIFYRLYPKVWAHREQIIKKDGAFFINHDYSKLVKDDSKKSMIINIIGIIKYEYDKLTDNDRESLWDHMLKILHQVATFLKAVNASK